MIVAAFLTNTLLQRGVLRRAEKQNRFNFNGFYALSKTAEAVKTRPPHPDTPLKQGVNEKKPLGMARFVKHSDWSEKRGVDAGSLENDKRRSASSCAFLAGFVCVQATRILGQRLLRASGLRATSRTITWNFEL